MIPKSHLLVHIFVVAALLNCSCAAWVSSDEFLPGRVVGIIDSDQLSECSGIVASGKNPDVLWVHNDSGDSPRIFAINSKADLLGTYTITGARARDWEDIAVGPGPDPNETYLYVGDIGDNEARYADVAVYRVPEPNVDAASRFGTKATHAADVITLRYPDGPRDAETLLVDPLTGDIYIIAKRALFVKVYRATYPQSTKHVTKTEKVATLPWGFAVAGDVSPDGRRVIVRGMFNASMWDRPAGKPLWRAFAGSQTHLPLAKERQGEGICFDHKGRGYFTIGEMVHPPLHYFARATDKSTEDEPAPK